MIRKLQVAIIALIASCSVSLGQGTGKIKGLVIDKSTKEPLPFVGVLVEQNGVVKASGTTDFDGYFLISSLIPGSYTVKVKFVGYKDVTIEGVTVKNEQITFIDGANTIALNPSDVLDEVEVIAYSVPLIDKDGGASGGTITRDDIAKMPGRSATAIATTVGGVYQDAGSQGALSVRGSRSSSTFYFIDGIKVRGSTNLPKAAIQEVQVITGGLPANYGDATGGIISVTTRGPSSFYFGSVDILTSGIAVGGNDLGYGRKVFGLDKFAYNLVEGSISGPLLMRKDSTGKKIKPLVGFFLSANYENQLDSRPVHNRIGNWRIKEDVLNGILDPEQQGYLRPSGTGFGAFYNTLYLQNSDFEKVAWRQNAGSSRFSGAGKMDYNPFPNVNVTFGGQFAFGKFQNYSYANSLMNWENNSESLSTTWRVYGRLTQRFTQDAESKSKMKNAYYSIMVDYSRSNDRTWDPRHKDNLFSYGYVGRYDIYKERSYEFSQLGQRVHNGFRDTLVVFTPSEVNTSMAALTNQYFTLYNSIDGNYENLNQISEGNALRNGDQPLAVYSIWNNIGRRTAGYDYSSASQFRITGNGSADVGNHAITIGFEFEQRSDRAFSASPYLSNVLNLWGNMRQITNSHLAELDVNNPTITQFGTFQQLDFERLNAAPGEYSASDAQYFFDYNLRKQLGLNPDGVDWINVDALDPTTLSLDMFSADELLNSGNSYVFYYGYDYTGAKQKRKPAWQDFFDATDEYGNKTRALPAFEPVYLSGYIMDKFAFKDLIFNVGLRVDRFDANQPVLRDPWLLNEAKTVGEVDALSEFGVAHPANMGSNYVVYVNDLNDPTGVRGYRRLNDNGTSTWFNASGNEIADPNVLFVGGRIMPYLVDPASATQDIKSTVFTDYRPQINAMPRIAFSFPISDEALFFAHYDILTKRPTEGNRLNMLDYFFIRNTNNIYNNPNLRPETTIDFELGFQQVLSKRSSLKLAAFYREQRNQVALFSFVGAFPVNYVSWTNIDFGTVKGMTIAYDLRRTGNIWLRAAYTLQFAEGTGSDATSALNLVNSGQPNLRTIYPYAYDQRHAITATVDYRYGEGSAYNGPKIGGKNILENTGANLVAFIGTGTPYNGQANITNAAAMNANNPILNGEISGSRKPGQFRVDAQIDRNVALKFGKDENAKSAFLNIYVQINNLFNTLNIVDVYRFTGVPTDDGYLESPVYQDQVPTLNDRNSFDNYYRLKMNNPFFYGLPRTIRLGLNFNF